MSYHGYVGDDYTPEDVDRPIVRIKKMSVLKDVYERIVVKEDEDGLVRKGFFISLHGQQQGEP